MPAASQALEPPIRGRADAMGLKKDGRILWQIKLRPPSRATFPSHLPEPPSRATFLSHLSPMAGVRGCNPLLAHIKQQSVVNIVNTDGDNDNDRTKN